MSRAGNALLAYMMSENPAKKPASAAEVRAVIAAIEAEAVANYRASLAATPSLEGATATTDAQGYVTSIEDSNA